MFNTVMKLSVSSDQCKSVHFVIQYTKCIIAFGFLPSKATAMETILISKIQKSIVFNTIHEEPKLFRALYGTHVFTHHWYTYWNSLIIL